MKTYSTIYHDIMSTKNIMSGHPRFNKAVHIITADKRVRCCAPKQTPERVQPPKIAINLKQKIFREEAKEDGTRVWIVKDDVTAPADGFSTGKPFWNEDDILITVNELSTSEWIADRGTVVWGYSLSTIEQYTPVPTLDDRDRRRRERLLTVMAYDKTTMLSSTKIETIIELGVNNPDPRVFQVVDKGRSYDEDFQGTINCDDWSNLGNIKAYPFDYKDGSYVDISGEADKGKRVRFPYRHAINYWGEVARLTPEGAVSEETDVIVTYDWPTAWEGIDDGKYTEQYTIVDNTQPIMYSSIGAIMKPIYKADLELFSKEKVDMFFPDFRRAGNALRGAVLDLRKRGVLAIDSCSEIPQSQIRWKILEDVFAIVREREWIGGMQWRHASIDWESSGLWSTYDDVDEEQDDQEWLEDAWKVGVVSTKDSDGWTSYYFWEDGIMASVTKHGSEWIDDDTFKDATINFKGTTDFIDFGGVGEMGLDKTTRFAAYYVTWFKWTRGDGQNVISLNVDDGAFLYITNLSLNNTRTVFIEKTCCGKVEKEYKFEKDNTYKIEVIYYQGRGNGRLKVQLDDVPLGKGLTRTRPYMAGYSINNILAARRTRLKVFDEAGNSNEIVSYNMTYKSDNLA